MAVFPADTKLKSKKAEKLQDLVISHYKNTFINDIKNVRRDINQKV